MRIGPIFVEPATARKQSLRAGLARRSEALWWLAHLCFILLSSLPWSCSQAATRKCTNNSLAICAGDGCHEHVRMLEACGSDRANDCSRSRALPRITGSVKSAAKVAAAMAVGWPPMPARCRARAASKALLRTGTSPGSGRRCSPWRTKRRTAGTWEESRAITEPVQLDSSCPAFASFAPLP